MFITHETEENQKNNIKRKESEELNGDWDTLGDELFYLKNKFEFSQKEKNALKKMLSKSPPQLQHRRRVINIFLSLFYYLVMVN